MKLLYKAFTNLTKAPAHILMKLSDSGYPYGFTTTVKFLQDVSPSCTVNYPQSFVTLDHVFVPNIFFNYENINARPYVKGQQHSTATIFISMVELK